MKYLDFYLKITGRYKIVIYITIASLILIAHKVLACALYALALHEIIMLFSEWQLKKHELKQENLKSELLVRELALCDKKEDVKVIKLKLKDK